jgi:hypothetical protein
LKFFFFKVREVNEVIAGLLRGAYVLGGVTKFGKGKKM